MFEEFSATGIRIICIMAVLGGGIALIADLIGKRIGKAHIRLFGLRPRQNARILTVLSGVLISCITIAVMVVTSESARVALMGMEKITQELKVLEREKDIAEKALRIAKAEVKKQNVVIDDLDNKIKDANATVDAAKKTVDELNEAKIKLAGEVVKLEKNNQVLKDGITTMREGELFYRAGEVVYTGVMRGNLSNEENVVQIEWFLRSANKATLEKLGIVSNDFNSENIPQAIVFKQETMNVALNALNHASNDKFFRVRTLTNVMVGEVSPCSIEIFDNKLIFKNDQVIYRQEFEMSKKEKREDTIVVELLRNVNKVSVEAGVLSDPITGKVGGMGADGLLKITSQIKKAGRHFVVEAKADGDIYVGGPVRLKFNVAKIVDE